MAHFKKSALPFLAIACHISSSSLMFYSFLFNFLGIVRSISPLCLTVLSIVLVIGERRSEVLNFEGKLMRWRGLISVQL